MKNCKEKDEGIERIIYYLGIVKENTKSGLMTENIVSKLALAEIRASFGDNFKIRFIGSGELSFEKVKEEVDNLRNENEKIKEKKYCFYIPINFKIDHNEKISIELEGNDICFYPNTVLPHRDKLLDGNFISRSRSRKQDIDSNQSYAMISIYGKHINDAFENVMIIFDRFRSVFNFICSRHNSQYQKNNSSTQNVFLNPKWIIYECEGSWKCDPIIQSDMRSTVAKKYGEDHIYEAYILAKSLIGPKGSFKSFLRDIIMLYSDARELEYENEAMIAYWRVLERIALQSECGGKHVNVINYVGKIFRCLGFQYPPYALLQYMSDARNKFVHTGEYKYKYNLSDINLVVVGVIEWLIYSREFFDDEKQLEYFYKNLDVNMSDEDIESFIEKIRDLQEGKDKI